MKISFAYEVRAKYHQQPNEMHENGKRTKYSISENDVFVWARKKDFYLMTAKNNQIESQECNAILFSSVAARKLQTRKK